MAKLTKQTSETLTPDASIDSPNVTFSQALAAGHTHSGWLVGQTTDQCGQDLALASHSVSPAKAKDLTTHVTYGPLFDGSSPTIDLQHHLENKLQAMMDVNGSPEYVLTWKQWAMQSGVPICALRASVRRTSDSGSGGLDCWPTPTAHKLTPQSRDNRCLARDVFLAGWVSPTAQDHSRGNKPARQWDTGIPLSQQAITAGWPTPNATDGSKAPKTFAGGNPSLPSAAKMTICGGLALMGRAVESLHERINYRGLLEAVARPMNAGKSSRSLNPRFSLWLMGYPPNVWASCAVRGMQSIRGSRRSS